MEPLSWIDETKLVVEYLNENENALPYLHKNRRLIRMRHMITNPSYKIMNMDYNTIFSLSFA